MRSNVCATRDPSLGVASEVLTPTHPPALPPALPPARPPLPRATPPRCIGCVARWPTLAPLASHRRADWDPSVCFNFGSSVLEWLREQVAKADTATSKRFVLRHEPSTGALHLAVDDAAAPSGASAQSDPPPAKRARVD